MTCDQRDDDDRSDVYDDDGVGRHNDNVDVLKMTIMMMLMLMIEFWCRGESRNCN